MKLKRYQTMKRAYEFAHVRSAGSSTAGRLLVLSVAPIATLTRKTAATSLATESSLPASQAVSQGSRFGIIATKRVGDAVMRNTLRRRVREVLRLHGEPLSQDLYVVIILRHRAAEATYAQIEREFLKLLPRLLRALEKNPQQLPPTC